MSIKYLKSYFLRPKSFQGFTLIELLIVFSVIAIISSVGIASYQKYSDTQKLRAAALGLKTVLQQARSQALSQVVPSGCGTFQGYEVRICCVPSGSNCPIHSCSENYQAYALCSNNADGMPISATGISLPSGVSIDNAGTTLRTFSFIPITGGIVQGGTIVLGLHGVTQTITVSSAGVIQ